MIADSSTQVKEFMEEGKVRTEELLQILLDPQSGAETVEMASKELDDISLRGEAMNKLMNLGKKLQDDEADGKADDKDQWQDAGEFLRAVRDAKTRNVYDKRLSYYHEKRDQIFTKDISSYVGADGGFLLNTERMRGIQAHIMEESIVMPRANVIPMNSRQLEITRLDQADDTANQFHWYGGIVAYWTEEAREISQTFPTFKTDMLNAHKLAAAATVPNETLDDANNGASLESVITGRMGFAGALTAYMDLAFIRGNGVGQPLGFMTSNALIGVDPTTAGATELADLAKVRSNVLPGTNYVWIINIKMIDQLMTLQGNTNQYVLLWGDVQRGLPTSLLGYPVIFTEKVPVDGQKGCLGLYDLDFYNIGNRAMITIDFDTSLKFLEFQTVFRAIARVDGRPAIEKPFTLYDGTNKLSPFVALNS